MAFKQKTQVSQLAFFILLMIFNITSLLLYVYEFVF